MTLQAGRSLRLNPELSGSGQAPDVAYSPGAPLSSIRADRQKRKALVIGNRVDWVDFAKGLGIFLVVVGHTLGGLSNSGVLPENGFSAFVVQFIYYFHMPLFFFLAGLFVRTSARRPMLPYMGNKLSVIVYPYFVWSLIEGTMQHFVSKTIYHSISWGDLIKISYIPIDQYWFLYTIFILYIVFWILCRWAVSASVIFGMAILYYIIEVSGIEGTTWTVLHSLGSVSLYFALGALVAETTLLARLGTLPLLRLLVLAIGGYGLIAIVVVADEWWPPIFRAILSVIGIGSTIALAIAFQRTKIWSFVKVFGVFSLEIYVSHTIFSAGLRIAFQKVLGYEGALFHVILGVVAGIYFPILFAIACSKVGLPYVFTASRTRQYAKVSSVRFGLVR